jgi:O-antigen/teichoic acid export membrane protein
MRQFLLLALPGRIIQFILVVLAMRVATHYLSPSEMGQLSIYITVTAFFTVIFIYPVGTFVNRRLITWGQKGLITHYFNYYWKYLLCISLIVALVLLLNEFIQLFNLNSSILWLLLLICGTLIFNTVNQTLIGTLNQLNYRNWFLGLSILTILFGFVTSFLLVFITKPSSEFWFLGQMIGQVLGGMVSWKVLYTKIPPNKIKSQLTSNHISSLFAFSWPVSIAVLLNWTQTQGYRFLIEDSLGLAPLGLFFAGYAVSAGLIGAVETILATYFQPNFYKKISSSADVDISKGWNEYAEILIPALILTAIFIVAFSRELAILLLSSKFLSASKFIMWGAIAELFRSITGVFGLISHAKMNTKLLLWPHAIGAFISIALSWFLIPTLGSDGVALSLVVAGFGTLSSVFFYAKPHINISLSPLRLALSFFIGVFFLVMNFMNVGDESLMKLIISGLVFGLIQLLFLKPYLKRHI